jgi:hypothetical protein
MKRTAQVAAMAGLLLLPACSARRPALDDSAATTLSVRNDHWLDHTIYLIRGTERIRIGTARGLALTRLKIPSQYVFGVTSLRFLADPIGGQADAVSENVVVTAGEQIQMVIRGTRTGSMLYRGPPRP